MVGRLYAVGEAIAVKRLIRYGLSWAVTLGLMAWVLNQVPWTKVWSYAAQVSIGPLLMAVFLSLLGNIWPACQKYRLILRGLGIRMSLREVVLLKVGSIPMKNILPFKSGEAVRVIYLRRTQGLSYLRGGASVALNFVMSLLALGLLMIPGYLSVRHGPLDLALIGLLVLLSAFGLWRLGRGEGRHENQTGDRPLVNGLREGLVSLVKERRGAVVGLVASSVMFEGIKIANYGLLFQAMGITVPWEYLFQAVPLLILVSGLPVSIMGLGLREGGVLLAFAGMADEANLVSTGLWISMVEGIVPLLAGLVLLKAFLTRLIVEQKRADGDQEIRSVTNTR